MSDDEVRDEFVDRAVGVLLTTAARSGMVAQADEFLLLVRSELARLIADFEREGKEPQIVDGFRRLLGRLVDAMETGGTRR